MRNKSGLDSYQLVSCSNQMLGYGTWFHTMLETIGSLSLYELLLFFIAITLTVQH